jgi:hypothetical protein
MKAIYAKYLKDALKKKLADRLPQFEPFSVRLTKEQRAASTMMPGEQVFVWKATPQFWVFLSFIPHSRQERFTSDIGWSKKQRFPWDVPRPTIYSVGKDLSEANLDEAMVDFTDLLKRETGSGVFFGWDVWKCSVPPEHPDFKKIFIAEDLRPVSDEEANRLAENAASLAVDDVVRYAMPYIRSVVSSVEARDSGQ